MSVLRVLLICFIAIGLVVSISSLPPALAEVTKPENVNYLYSQANQIKLLLGIIFFMLGSCIWWIKRYITKNDEKHEMHFETANTLAFLMGEHKAIQEAKKRD